VDVREHGLGRRQEFDERSRLWKVRGLIDEYEDQINRTLTPRSWVWAPNRGLDQGPDGACVGFCLTHIMGGDPVRRDGLTYDYAFGWYGEAKTKDEWAGEDYDGTSVLAGCKVAVDRGMASGYRWIGAGSGTPVEDAVTTLGYIGPIALGINWYDSMFEPRPSGLLEVSGSIAGGHAIMAFAVWLGAQLPGEASRHDVVCLQQSWGPWGVGAYGQPTGMCYMKLEDLDMLLGENGEGAVLTEIQPGVEQLPFSDISGHTHQEGITRAAAAGLLGGYPDGTFRPDQPVTRGQLATILARALDLP
jgi:hypothetical protein